MEAHQERTLKNHLDNLSEDDLQNVKDHADNADSEEHHSFKTLLKYVGSVLGVTGTAGLTWKAIKIIRGH